MMSGYCSNSPLRCSYAMSMAVITQSNGQCPQCKMSLVADSSMNGSSHIEQSVLQLGLIIVVLLLLLLTYVYYASLV